MVAAVVFATVAAAAPPVVVTSGDGLALEFSAADGAIAAVRCNGVALPTAAGEPGGLSIAVGRAAVGEDLVRLDFDEDDATWVPARNSEWDHSAAYAERTVDGGRDGSGGLVLGDGSTAGAGMAMADRFEVAGSPSLRISWWARSASTATAQILNVRVFDAAGVEITSADNAPPGWGWTETSAAHGVWGMQCDHPDTWERFERDYPVPDGAASARISLRVWTGGDLWMVVDDLAATPAGIDWGDAHPLLAPPEPAPEGSVRQTATVVDPPIAVTWTTRGERDGIAIEIDLEALGPEAMDRPLKLRWTLPVDLDGWTWWDDADESRPVNAAPGTLENTQVIGGHAVSLYPMACVTGSGCAVAMSTPPDEITAQRFDVDADRVLRTRWDLALSPETIAFGSGHARVSTTLMRTDPAWGFRDALARYHERYPDAFRKRTPREGGWQYPIGADRIPDPGDFGFGYWETHPVSEAERAAAAAHGIGVYYYVEPWLAWQPYGSDPEKPPFSERMAMIEAWAAGEGEYALRVSEGDGTWFLRLGDGVTPGTGMATEPIDRGGETDAIRVRWHARVPSTDNLQILCVRVYDVAGSDITASVPVPSGWGWSGTSRAHYIAGIACSGPGTWETFERVYAFPAAAASARVSIRYWNGGSGIVDVDRIRIEDAVDARLLQAFGFTDPDESWTTAQNEDWDQAGAVWLRAPRAWTAQAVLNSSPHDRDGRPYIDAGPYLWNQWAMSSQGWPVHSHPDVPSPNTWELYLNHWILPYIDDVEGIYIDSVLARPPVGGWVNYRHEHVATAGHPLTFAIDTGEAVILGPQAFDGVLAALREELRGRDRLMMLNLFPHAMRFHAPTADVMGSEVSDLVEPAWKSRIRRALAGTRIVSNLLQYHWDGEYGSHEDVETYLEGQLQWGFYPGISSIGGPRTNGAPDRYFLHPEFYERDRALFRRYVPLVRRVSAAGWEPRTCATVDDPSVTIERFGSFDRGEVLFTVRYGDAASAVPITIRVDTAGCGLAPGARVTIHDLVAGSERSAYREGDGMHEFDVIPVPGRVGVFGLAAHASDTLETE